MMIHIVVGLFPYEYKGSESENIHLRRICEPRRGVKEQDHRGKHS
jgi:hypothetical protein